MGTVLGGLLLPKFDTFDYGRSMNQGILGATQQVQGQTALLTLQEEREKQAAQALIFERVKNDPELARQLLGGSTIGSLPTTSAAPPGGALTQQAFGPTGPSGPAQVVPGGQDLSRFAGVSPQGGGPIPPGVMGQVMPQAQPPQSVLGSLGPAGQPQMPAPQNPLLEMARTNPRAAMLLQGQMEQRQDMAMKRQEQNLKLGAATLGYVGQQAQAVTDQPSLDALRSDLQSQGLGKYAAQLPQLYTKEAMQPFIAKALDVEKSLTLQIAEQKARADQIRAGLAGRTDAVNTELEIMGLTPATASPAQLKEAADKAEARQVRIHKAGVTPQIVEGEGGVKYAIDPHTLERRPIPGGAPGTATAGPAGTTTGEPMRGPMSPDDKKIADYTSRMREAQQQLTPLEESGDYTSWKAPVSRLPGGRLALSDKQQQYETAKGLFLQGILRRDSQGQISAQEWADYSRDYFPQPGEGPEIVKQKQAMRDGAIRAQQAVLGRPGVPQPTPPSQGSAKPVGQMSREELLAERDRLRKGGS